MSESEPELPRHPVYVISKGRSDCCLTAKFLMTDGVPFRLVVEPPEADAYREAGYADHVVELPFHDLGQGSIPARNWVWEDAIARGAERHWILDDNIRYVKQWRAGARRMARSGRAFRAAEQVTDGYVNVGVSGLNYDTFAIPGCPPFYVNTHVYSCILLQNDLPYRWRGRYNEDTDLCLQILAGGRCSILLNAYVVCKVATMTMKGGNATELYRGDGRLKMARALERQWPGVAKVVRRFKRPQHYVDWSIFDTPLVAAGSPEADGWVPRAIVNESPPGGWDDY